MKAVDPSLAHRLFYPDVPAVLAASHGGRVSGMPVVSFMSLSERPPIVGVSCASESFTLKLAIASGAFSLCILDRKHARSLAYLGSHSGKESSDKLRASGLKHTRGKRVRAPVISESVAVLECAPVGRSVIGDHTLLLGFVSAAFASADFHDYWRFRTYRPLLYTGWRGGLTAYSGR